MLSLAMINSAYELNDFIPNIEMVLYRIFMSPITTKDLRKESDDLLEGNLFCRKGIDLPNEIYRSLLETMVLYPKKKHFKKLLEHIIRNKEKEDIDPEIYRFIVNLAIDHGYPILMG